LEHDLLQERAIGDMEIARNGIFTVGTPTLGKALSASAKRELMFNVINSNVSSLTF
jgi:hypothetical protein